MEQLHHNNELENQELEGSEFPQARDILIHFNKNIYPEIEQKYHPKNGVIQDKTSDKLLILFGFKKKESDNNTNERSYEELGIQTSQGITNFVLGDHPTDPSRIQLLLQAMWLDMMSTAYGNVYLDYSRASSRYGEAGDEVKQNIIKECLKICDKKFWSKVGTLSITDNHVIFEYIISGEKIVQDKKDFLKNYA